MENVYILSACRTPIGKMGGALSKYEAADLASIVIKDLLKHSGLSPKDIDHVYLGCVLQAAKGQNIARQASLKAGLPLETTAVTLNVVCGSGLESVNEAARLIKSGDAYIVIAGGTESMSNATFALKNARFGYRIGYPQGKSELVDTMVHDALWDVMYDCHMGITAENVAAKYHLTRSELDEFALDSQRKAQLAIESGEFVDEITPITVKEKEKEIIIDKDENPRFNLTIENLAKLKPAFASNGILTAGNSSSINDGAAGVILISESKLKELGLTPMAKWLGGALGGVDPQIMGMGPVASTRKLLNRLNLKIDDFDLVEANEAFASQSIAVSRELGFNQQKTNVNGGAIALGHPVGASGCRILVTLLYALIHQHKNLGLATLCVGGGMGCSTAVEMKGDVSC